MKEVQYRFIKPCLEFNKQIDPELSFFYHRFYKGPLPEFNEPASGKRKLPRAPRREQPSAFAVKRATMPVRGSLALRPQFHNLPLELPPITIDQIYIVEHSYVSNHTYQQHTFF